MKRRGFTLVELLAVIVILALIALITIPIILNVVEKSKIKTYQRSIDAYGGAVNKAIAEYLLDHEDKSTASITYNDIKDYIKYEGNKVECTVNIYKDKTVYLENCKVNGESVDYTYGIYQYIPVNASETEDYRGYYADVDGNGTVDGVIYADLAHSKSGEFYNKDINQGLDGIYSYEALEDLKEYTISENKYTGEKAKFGEKEIITLKPNSTGNKRFYVMAIEDFTTGSMSDGHYYWYKNAPDVSDTSKVFGTGYTNTGNIIEIWNKNGTGEGSYIGATQDNYDIFKHIQEEYAKGWYIPSRGEWAAFANYLKEEQSLTNDCSTEACNDNGNYDHVYGLSVRYWSSSQYHSGNAWDVDFYYGFIGNCSASDIGYVRLGVTF